MYRTWICEVLILHRFYNEESFVAECLCTVRQRKLFRSYFYTVFCSSEEICQNMDLGGNDLEAKSHRSEYLCKKLSEFTAIFKTISGKARTYFRQRGKDGISQFFSRQRKWWVLMCGHFRFLAGPLSPQYLSCVVKNGSINTFCFHEPLHGSWLERSIMCLRLWVISSLFFSVDYYNVCEQVWSKQIIYSTQQCGLLEQHVSKAVESGFRESWQITTMFIIVTASVGVWFNLINITVGAQWQ